ncbi:hypothetical protein [Rhodococcus qingshengii]|nr:hypothetical protein [Rhodococcus qingshengii]MBX9151982.1 hypothetical protein [Rhodococcus qingshengii]
MVPKDATFVDAFNSAALAGAISDYTETRHVPNGATEHLDGTLHTG